MDKYERMALRDEILQMTKLFVDATKARESMLKETNPNKLVDLQERWETMAGRALRARETLWAKIDEL